MTYGVLTVRPKAAGIATARAVKRVINFIFVGERVREVSLRVPNTKVVVKKMGDKEQSWRPSWGICSEFEFISRAAMYIFLDPEFITK